MREFFILFILALALFSGCITFTSEETYKILLEDGEIYNQDDPFYGLTFCLPTGNVDVSENIDIKEGVFISAEIFRPDDTSLGTTTKSFYPVEGCLTIQYSTTLYYPGRWSVEYEIHEGVTRTQTPALIGHGSFYVMPNGTALSNFELTEFECPSNVNYSQSFYVNFTIKNTGVEPDTIVVSLFDNDFQENELGHHWFIKSYYLEDGEQLHEEVYISIPTADLNVTLRYNENEVSQLVDVGGVDTHPKSDEIPLDLVYGVILVLIVIVLFYIGFRR